MKNGQFTTSFSLTFLFGSTINIKSVFFIGIADSWIQTQVPGNRSSCFAKGATAPVLKSWKFLHQKFLATNIAAPWAEIVAQAAQSSHGLNKFIGNLYLLH